MIGKAGLVTVVLAGIVLIGHSVHPRTLYDQMYPVNSLKRHAFNLCHESDPAFIRAVNEDRVACYGRMPYSISLALGIVRPASQLAAFFSPLGRLPDGGALLPNAAAWAAVARQPLLYPRVDPRALGVPAGSVPCPVASAESADLAGPANRADPLDRTVLAELGLAPHDAKLTPPGPAPAAGGRPGLALLDAAGANAAAPAPATGCAARI